MFSESTLYLTKKKKLCALFKQQKSNGYNIAHNIMFKQQEILSYNGADNCLFNK